MAQTIGQIFDEAVRHHQAGNLAQAAQLYGQVISTFPAHVGALHLCGVLAFELGAPAEALALIDRAIARQSDVADFHGNRGIVLARLNRHEEASAAYRKAIALKEAYPDAHYNLGNALKELRKLDEAMISWKRAASLRPGFAEAHFNLANAFRQKGDLNAAIQDYEKAIAYKPQFTEAHHSLAATLLEGGQATKAIDACRAAIVLKPDDVDSINTLASALSAAGNKPEAMHWYQKIIALRPQFADPHNNIGIILAEQSHWPQAIEAFERAIALKPDYVEAHFNLANALRDSGKSDEAIESFRRALAIKPDHSPAALNLPNMLKNQGRIYQAIPFYRQALAGDPANQTIHSTLIFSMHLDPLSTGPSILAEAQNWNARHASTKAISAHQNDPLPDRLLRIGYLSADFREHATAWVLLPLLQKRDANRFRIYCYSNHPHCDAVTERFQAYADSWRSVFAVSDDEAARWIREDQIDVLVDLSMHTAGNRLSLMSKKPAPVQVSWLGYPGTTGVEAIDYHITDHYLSPAGKSENHYSEKLIRLPESYWCFDPSATEPQPNLVPHDQNGLITFGCLNSFSKINEGTLKCWARLMQQVPDSRLLLLAPPGSHRQQAIETLGVSPQRVEFSGFVPRHEYLRLYHKIDIALDTFPYNGHTTTLDALWMGVPVVSLSGELAVGRAGLSQLSTLGLAELVAGSSGEYVTLAAQLARDPARLRELRSTLRPRMLQSPLMNARRFAQKIESAYREIWRHWCSTRGNP